MAFAIRARFNAGVNAVGLIATSSAPSPPPPPSLIVWGIDLANVVRLSNGQTVPLL